MERFIEPAILVLLRERSMHGYELLEQLPELVGDEAGPDLGNLYRVLRGLELEGVLTSRWDVDAPGPARRVYALTGLGTILLDDWIRALAKTRSAIDVFLERYERGERR